ncbi:hypothetical protein ONS95_013256 [Cadophora gregata]|uniref:uncharacterized protein n=1 Tax=Cadophora gregata TaxID=51156 RepID=UPI0026DBD6AA|nr:uncharacterized protein ONS95_013256 [Cadophora gregata]KAK0099920.1 hypothetical protein ONS96_007868 [Cadophora gregata f. sp. sojae]KAK0116231.1 hypothetical protein ONS95_013256 [Cadophora gregata]
MTAMKIASIESKRDKKGALVASSATKKGTSQIQPDQPSSSQLKPVNGTKSPEDSQPHQEVKRPSQASYVLGPESDIIDRSTLVLTTPPDITNMLCYFYNEAWFREQVNSDYGPLPPNENSTITFLELLDKMREVKEEEDLKWKSEKSRKNRKKNSKRKLLIKLKKKTGNATDLSQEQTG